MTEYEHMSSDDILRRIELSLENPRASIPTTT